ncbi:MAG: tannase/feruloyl esterase family alpha/beta hydrolase [Bacteroidetes bacterium]|nr:tannase/feruloyl esterase family alpha/beta hydrolase [Bacteroidota bacterium]
MTTDTRAIHTAERVLASDRTEAYCRVTGQILPEVGFEVRLPDDWNGQFLMLGNGGFGGAIQAVIQGGFVPHLRAGFAVAATDTGHDADRQPLASFGVDRQKIIDFAYRAVHVTTVAAKDLIADYYGSGPKLSYFSGGSTGGRQGLMAAQRFPADYDGILVAFPVLDQTSHHLASIHTMQAMEKAPIHMNQLPTLAEHVYARCDGVDGVEDGLIAEPLRCPFDPAADLPRCNDGIARPSCFTDGQIGTLQVVYGDVKSQGETIMPGLPVGASAQGRVVGPFPPYVGSGWNPYLVNQNERPFRLQGSASFLQYMAFDTPRPEYDWRDFDVDTDPGRIRWIRTVLDATDPDLSAFRAEGGKLLMYHGWADSGPNPRMSIRYYETVRDTMDAPVTDFFRLFMIPGMFHGGGIGNPSVDAFAALRAWVETDTAPDRLTISYHEDGEVVRTRPACPYPQVARSMGTGSTEEAENFECVTPE